VTPACDGCNDANASHRFLCALAYLTTVAFPRPVSGIVGYGLQRSASEEGPFISHPCDSGLVANLVPC